MPDQHTYNSSIFVHVDKFETFVNILTCELSVALLRGNNSHC